MTEIRACLIDLGAREDDLTPQEIERIANSSNLDGDEKIDFREFLIASAMGCFLHESASENNAPDFLVVKKGFQVVQNAFSLIDKDGSGEIDFEELKRAFLCMKADDEMMLERLKELDFNGDKSIEFPEFLYGLCAWVGLDDTDCETLEKELSPQMNNPGFNDHPIINADDFKSDESIKDREKLLGPEK